MSQQAIRWEIYEDDTAQFRARFVAGNGEVLFVASESYRNREDLEHAIDVLEAAVRSTVGNGSYSTLPRNRVSL